MSKHHQPHKIGLGRAFLDRASLIFVVLILLVIASTSSAIYAEYKTGYLHKKLVKPVQDFFNEAGKALQNTTPDLTDVHTTISTSSGSINIDIKTNIQTDYSTPYSTPYYTPIKSIYLTPYSYPTPLKSYEELLEEQEAWSKQKQAENQAWYDQKVQESLKQLEEWKKLHGF